METRSSRNLCFSPIISGRNPGRRAFTPPRGGTICGGMGYLGGGVLLSPRFRSTLVPKRRGKFLANFRKASTPQKANELKCNTHTHTQKNGCIPPNPHPPRQPCWEKNAPPACVCSDASKDIQILLLPGEIHRIMIFKRRGCHYLFKSDCHRRVHVICLF